MKKILILFIVLTSCNNKNIDLNDDESISIKNCISFIIKKNKEVNKCYIVSPAFDNFSLDGFSDKEKIKHIKTFFEDKDSFNKIKKQMDSRFKGKRSTDMLNNSTCDKSSFILSFSGISEDDIIFVKLTRLSKNIDKNSVLNEVKMLPEEVEYFLFKLENNQIINSAHEVVFYN